MSKFGTKRFFCVGAKPSSLYNFRGHLLSSIKNLEFEVTAIASGAKNDEIRIVESLGAKYLEVPINRNGLNPSQDLKTLKELRKVFRQRRPDVTLAYTIKPIIWGGLAVRVVPNCKFYALITGLGFSFQKGGWKKNLLVKLVSILYKFALRHAEKVIFQNSDNQKVFIDQGIVPEHKTCVVNGSGVDLSHFKLSPLTLEQPKFLLIARLLGDKGIREYIKAANIVKKQYPHAHFQLVGPEDPSPNGISIAELNKLNIDNSVEYVGHTTDVRPFLEQCTIFVLPSYHEGLPRTVLEAMAIGRPILTTDVPGCRETVVEGLNGFLVEKGNTEQLADRMKWFIDNPEEWHKMAQASRMMVEDKFDVHKVNNELIRIMNLDYTNNFSKTDEV